MFKSIISRIILAWEYRKRAIIKGTYQEIVKKRVASYGNNLRINGSVIGDLSILHLGNDVNINPNCTVIGEAPIFIGDYFHCGMNLTIISSNHNYMGTKIPYDSSLMSSEIRIENFVWIGHNVIILPGITIGEGAIIGAGAVVSKDIPPLAIAAGNPIKVIKYRDSNHFNDLKNKEQFH